MLDAGYWMLDAGCSILDAGFRLRRIDPARRTGLNKTLGTAEG